MLIFQRVSLLSWLFCIGILTCIPNSHAVDTFKMNPPESENDHRYQYTYDLLTLIIEATNNDFGVASIQISDDTMSRNRIFRELLEGNNINVMAEASNAQWDEQLIPIKIPIRKGIQCFRVFIIKDKNVSIMANVNTLSQLVALETGSGSQWSSKAAMQSAGLRVFTMIICLICYLWGGL